MKHFIASVLSAFIFTYSTAPSSAQDIIPVAPEAIISLQARADALAREDDNTRDDDVYYATLRESLKALLGGDAEALRSPLGGMDFEINPMEASAPVPGLDDNPVEQRRLDQILERGRNGDLRIRVVGGHVVALNEFTETVAIINSIPDLNGNHGVCSGTVIGERLVLTAAHCACGMDLASKGSGAAEVIFANPTVRALVGDKQVPRANVDRSGTQFLEDDYCQRMAAGTACGGDIAVLQLESDRPHYVKIADVGFNDGELIYDASAATVVGFGLTSDADRQNFRVRSWPNELPPGKNWASILLPRRCGASFQQCTEGTTGHGCEAGREIVLFRPGKDTCAGDSGGPLFRPINGAPGKKEKHTVDGVTSRALSADGTCGEGGIYTATFTDEAKTFFKGLGLE